jgi:FkbM family methyltransferase
MGSFLMIKLPVNRILQHILDFIGHDFKIKVPFNIEESIPNLFTHFEIAKFDVKKPDIPVFLKMQFGQYYEDSVLFGLFYALERKGIFTFPFKYLELGANNPISTSNTYLFYKLKLGKGVLVEANPNLLKDLQFIRPNDFVINKAITPSRHAEKVDFFVCEADELSSVSSDFVEAFRLHSLNENQLQQFSIKEKIQLEAVTCDELFEQHGFFELLIIDLEGIDLEVLKHLESRPFIIVIEHSVKFKLDIEKVALEKGYKLYSSLPINDIYLRSDLW